MTKKSIFLIVYIIIQFSLNINIIFCSGEKPEQSEKVTCPMDRVEFSPTPQKIGKFIGKDSDLMPHYLDGFPPQQLISCPNCGFTGPKNWFSATFSDPMRYAFLKEYRPQLVFKNKLGREPQIESYADRSYLAYWTTLAIPKPEMERFYWAMKASYATRYYTEGVEEARGALKNFCQMQMLTDWITIDFDFDLISLALKRLKTIPPPPEESIAIYFSIATLLRFHGENPEVLTYIKNIEEISTKVSVELKEKFLNKSQNLRKSIAVEQKFQRAALLSASLSLENGEVSIFDIPMIFYLTAELNRRLNAVEEAKRLYLLGQKFSLPSNPETISMIDRQAKLVRVEPNPSNTPIIYQYIFLLLGLLLYGYIELEGKMLKEFSEWRRRYYFKRVAVILLISSFLCFQSARADLTTVISQVSFLLSTIFLIFAFYAIYANLMDEKRFPLVWQHHISIEKWQDFFEDMKRRLEMKFFDTADLNYRENGNFSFSSIRKKHRAPQDRLKLKINFEVIKEGRDFEIQGEVVPLQPIVIPGSEIKYCRRLLKYIFGQEKEFKNIYERPAIVYFLIPLILIFLLIIIITLINFKVLMYLPHHFFLIFPMFLILGHFLAFFQIFLKRKASTGFLLSFMSLLFLAIIIFTFFKMIKIPTF